MNKLGFRVIHGEEDIAIILVEKLGKFLYVRNVMNKCIKYLPLI